MQTRRTGKDPDPGRSERALRRQKRNVSPASSPEPSARPFKFQRRAGPSKDSRRAVAASATALSRSSSSLQSDVVADDSDSGEDVINVAIPQAHLAAMSEEDDEVEEDGEVEEEDGMDTAADAPESFNTLAVPHQQSHDNSGEPNAISQAGLASSANPMDPAGAHVDLTATSSTPGTSASVQQFAVDSAASPAPGTSTATLVPGSLPVTSVDGRVPTPLLQGPHGASPQSSITGPRPALASDIVDVPPAAEVIEASPQRVKLTKIQWLRRSLGLRKGEPLPYPYFVKTKARASLGLDEDDALPPGYTPESAIPLGSSPEPVPSPSDNNSGAQAGSGAAATLGQSAASTSPKPSLATISSEPEAFIAPSEPTADTSPLEPVTKSSAISVDSADADLDLSEHGESYSVTGPQVVVTSPRREQLVAQADALLSLALANTPVEPAPGSASLRPPPQLTLIQRLAYERRQRRLADGLSHEEIDAEIAEQDAYGSAIEAKEAAEAEAAAADSEEDTSKKRGRPGKPPGARGKPMADSPDSDDVPLIKRPRKDRAAEDEAAASQNEPVFGRLRPRLARPKAPRSRSASYEEDDGSFHEEDTDHESEADSAIQSDEDDHEEFDGGESDESPSAKRVGASRKASVRDLRPGASSTKPPVKPTRGRPGKAAASTASTAKKDITPLQNKFLKLRENFRSSSDPSLIYADKLRLFLADSDILRRVAPYKRDEAGILLTDILQLPVLPGAPAWEVILSAKHSVKSKRGLTLMFRHGHGKSRIDTQVRIDYLLVPKDEPGSRDKALAIAKRVTDMLRRFAFMNLTGRKISHLVRAVAYCLFQTPNLVQLPILHSFEGMVLSVHHIDPVSRSKVVKRILYRPGNFEHVDLDDIPDVERLCQFVTGNGLNEVKREIRPDGTKFTPSVITAAYDKKHGQNAQKLERFLRYVAHQTSNQIISARALDDQIKDMLVDMGGDVKGYNRSYGGHPLMRGTVHLAQRVVYYSFGTKPKQDIAGTTGTMQDFARVNTTDGGLASIPLDIGVKHFRGSGDPRVGALYSSEAADYVNAQVIAQEVDNSSCGCDHKMSKELTHHCHGCLRERTCASLVWYNGSRICKKCKNKLETKTSSDNVSAIMLKSLRYNHGKECKVLDKDPQAPAERKRLNDMVAKFADHYGAEDSYRDDYATMDRQIAGFTEIHAGGRNPFVCSVDATEPYGMSHDNTMRVHTEENVAMSTAGYNNMKYRHLIAFLVELGEYDPSASHTAQQKQHLESLCDEFYLVALKTPFTKKARLQGRGRNDLPADQAEWRRGKPVDEQGPWTQTYWHWSIRNVPDISVCEWDEETVERLSKLAEEIQLSFGKTLQKCKDGAPWITEAGGRAPPKSWGWACWAVAMRQRLDRTTKVCNRHGITIDTSEGFFAEFIYQICTDELEYKEFFDLPRVFFIRHPLCVSVGHKEHGKSMQTGWPKHPRVLADRVNKNNNILIETWTSNTAKMDMSDERCAALRDDVKNVKLVRSELYDKTVAKTVKRNPAIKFANLDMDDFSKELITTGVEVMEDDGEDDDGDDENDDEVDEDEGDDMEE